MRHRQIALSAIFLIFMDRILILCDASEATWDLCINYLTIVSFCGPFVLIANCFNNVIRAEGKSMKAMMGQLLGNLANVILDPIFISGFGWGVSGAAVATVIGNLLCYKAEVEGIRFVETEESYTSAADFLKQDLIPVYGQVEEKPFFSGKRTCCGLYRTGSGRTLNADVNGSANILRKAVPDVQHTRGWDSGVLKAPVPLIVV